MSSFFNLVFLFLSKYPNKPVLSFSSADTDLSLFKKTVLFLFCFKLSTASFNFEVTLGGVGSKGCSIILSLSNFFSYSVILGFVSKGTTLSLLNRLPKTLAAPFNPLAPYLLKVKNLKQLIQLKLLCLMF